MLVSSEFIVSKLGEVLIGSQENDLEASTKHGEFLKIREKKYFFVNLSFLIINNHNSRASAAAAQEWHSDPKFSGKNCNLEKLYY